MVNVFDRLHLRMRLDRHRIEPALFTHHREGGFQCAKGLHVGARPQVLVLGEQRQAVDVPDRHDRAGEAAIIPGRRRSFLALDRVGVDIIARESVFRGDEIGRDALRHEVGRDGDHRIDRPGAARRTDADAAHRLDTSADRAIMLARHDLGRRKIHGVETGGTEAVDLHPGDVRAVSGGQRRSPRDVAAGLADRVDAAEHDIVDDGPVKAVAVLERGQRRRGQPERRDFMQRPIGLAAPARRAHVVVDEGVRHACLFGRGNVPRFPSCLSRPAGPRRST